MKRMMRFLTIFVLFVSTQAGRAMQDVLYVDLSNQDKEVEYCQKGLDEEYERTKQQPICRVVHVRPDPRCVPPQVLRLTAAVASTFRDKCGWSGRMTVCHVGAFIHQQESKGRRIDTVALSGESGGGHFWGEGGHVKMSDLSRVLRQTPRTRERIQLVMGNGCYTSTWGFCEENGMTNIGPNVQATVGYSTQAPTGDKPANYESMQHLCGQREKVRDLAGSGQMSTVLRALKGGYDTSLSICMKDRICSEEYAKMYGYGDKCEVSRADLDRLCNSNLLKPEDYENYTRYYLGEPGYGVPSVKDTSSFLRGYYTRIRLAEHCRLKPDYNPRTAPSPASVMRLIFSDEYKAQVASAHAEQLGFYNGLLDKVGLSQYRLDDLAGMSRG